MMVDRFGTERLAAERQGELARAAASPRPTTRGDQARSADARRTARVVRLVGAAALALVLLWGGLTAAVGGATPDPSAGGGGGAIGYVP